MPEGSAEHPCLGGWKYSCWTRPRIPAFDAQVGTASRVQGVAFELLGMDAFEFHERIWPTRDAIIPTSNSGMPEAGMAATCRCTTSSNISELGACRRCAHSFIKLPGVWTGLGVRKSIQLNFHTSQKEILNTSTWKRNAIWQQFFPRSTAPQRLSAYLGGGPTTTLGSCCRHLSCEQ